MGRIEEEEVVILYLTPKKPGVSFTDVQTASPRTVMEFVVCKRPPPYPLRIHVGLLGIPTCQNQLSKRPPTAPDSQVS